MPYDDINQSCSPCEYGMDKSYSRPEYGTAPGLIPEEADMDVPMLSYKGFTDGAVSARQFSVNIHNINNVNFNYGCYFPNDSQYDDSGNLLYNDSFEPTDTFSNASDPPSPKEEDVYDLSSHTANKWHSCGGCRRHFAKQERQPDQKPLGDHSRDFSEVEIPPTYTYPYIFNLPRRQPSPPASPQFTPQPQPQPAPVPQRTPTEVPNTIPSWAAASRNTMFSRPGQNPPKVSGLTPDAAKQPSCPRKQVSFKPEPKVNLFNSGPDSTLYMPEPEPTFYKPVPGTTLFKPNAQNP